ncbi:MAG: YhbY family RNA-binding protein [Gammaproteobacteria bacterium]|nr:YhbY family RNA-binding protein [Gammaproteobacteria bacterium]
MSLTGKQKHHLRALAHHASPVVQFGTAGASDAVLAELDLALAHHELLKIRLPAVPRDQRQELVQQVCAASGAEVVGLVGRVAILFRAGDPPVIPLP